MGIFNLKGTCRICGKEFDLNSGAVLEKNGEKAMVCPSCGDSVALAMGYGKTKGETRREHVESISTDTMTPKAIKAELDRYVVGQEQAKKVLSVAAYNHHKRLQLNDKGIQKSNVMLVGPSGSGKTHLMKTLARILDAPLAICSATNLTESGWVGEDPVSVVGALLAVCDNNAQAAERGIIFIDEIDKIAAGASESKKQVGGQGVQQALLPIIEGSVVFVPVGVGPGASKVSVDTSNILFVVGGAFPKMEEMIRKRLGGDKANVIGFSNHEEEEQVPESDILLKTTNEDLKEFGFIPEFLGRVPVLACLEELTVDTLKKILFEPEDAIVTQYKKLFHYDGVDIEFTDDALTVIANKAKGHGTGARSLRKIMEELLLELQFTVPGSDYKKIVITKEFAAGETALPLMETR